MYGFDISFIYGTASASTSGHCVLSVSAGMELTASVIFISVSPVQMEYAKSKASCFICESFVTPNPCAPTITPSVPSVPAFTAGHGKNPQESSDSVASVTSFGTQEPCSTMTASPSPTSSWPSGCCAGALWLIYPAKNKILISSAASFACGICDQVQLRISCCTFSCPRYLASWYPYRRFTYSSSQVMALRPLSLFLILRHTLISFSQVSGISCSVSPASSHKSLLYQTPVI